MGKAENLRSKKKKGRPSLSDLRHRENHKLASTSTRRNPNSNSASPQPEFVGDDDDERKEKKVKLVVRLPESSNNHHQHLHHNSSSGNWASESDPDGENREASVKKRKINAVNRRSTDVVLDQGEKGLKATDAQHGSPLVSGPTTPLPDKKLLVFVLDRLQKKDTYGVFAEPVDPNELPDYHEIIEHPMDFGTVRKKLDGGLYSNLEELEADVFLICSNAMEYNAPDTIYFRQARSIQDLAKRDFGNLRHEGEDGELQPKVVRRGRPPSKNTKKPLESSPVDCVGPELSSGATLASGEDKAIGSNSYNLRKAPPFYRFHSTDASLGNRSRNGESYSEWSIDWNQEFPASILRADMKHGKKHFSVDENKRYTYKQVHPSASGNESSLFSNTNGDVKQLSAVGLHMERHAYARSLARFAANLGPVAWKVASRKLQHVLPPGVEFGPGWVGEGGAPPPQASLFSNERQNSSNSLASDYHSSRPVTPPAPSSHSAAAAVCTPSEAMIEAVRRLNSQNEMAGQHGVSSWTTPGSSSQAQQQPLFYPHRNGINGVLGNDLPTHMDCARLGTPKMHTAVQDGTVPSHMIGMVSGSEASSSSQQAPQSHLTSKGKNLPESDTRLSGESRLVVSGQHRQYFPVPPDLNVKVQPPGSPSSGLQIGSPHQPDLALQL